MISESSHTYFINGKARGVADSVLYEAIALRDIVRTRTGSAVPVLTLGHLAQLTNVDYAFLRRVIARSADPYFTIRINKRGRDRSKREISIPDRQLRWVQSWIHEHILSAIAPSQYSFAFFPGSSIYRCAEAHAGSRWLVKLDIRDFFHSVHEAQVYRIFRGLGYKSLMSFEFARLCTRIPTRKDPKLLYRVSKHYHVYPNVSTQVPAGALPMGAPSSPLLSNIFMTDFDKEIGALMLREHVTFTRYADDLFFSSSAGSFGRTDVHEIISLVRERLGVHGLRLNDNKIVVAPPGSRKIVLGLIVNGERPRLSHEFKARMRMHYHYLRLNGPAEHAMRRNFDSALSLERHLRGMISFAATVDQHFASQMLKQHYALPWGIWQVDEQAGRS